MTGAMVFTIEEMGVLSAVQHENRMAAATELGNLIPDIESADLKEASIRTKKKLENMTDADYLKVDFTAYEEDLREAEA